FTKHFRDYNIFLRIYRQLEKVELGLIQKDKLPIDLIGYGSNWCSISHELAREIVCSENLIFKIFNKGFLVDELFIPTLINIRGKSKFPIYYEKPVHNISDEFQGNPRYINWWDGSPKTWRISDFDEIKLAKQSGHFFSRKFDEKIDNEIIKKVIHELVI
ncbi:beta-1,6-N-acetylglucosaminyltransferase, partial [Secundilactobacillus paracollinoides]